MSHIRTEVAYADLLRAFSENYDLETATKLATNLTPTRLQILRQLDQQAGTLADLALGESQPD